MIKRTIRDMKDMYKGSIEIDEETVVYTADNVYYGESSEHLMAGITTIYPGKVGEEFFMTKGHNHIKSAGEVYYGLEGEAVILLKYEDEVEEEKILRPGEVVYCPPGVAHRAINKGQTISKFLCVCRADAGHNYNVKF